MRGSTVISSWLINMQLNTNNKRKQNIFFLNSLISGFTKQKMNGSNELNLLRYKLSGPFQVLDEVKITLDEQGQVEVHYVNISWIKLMACRTT